MHEEKLPQNIKADEIFIRLYNSDLNYKKRQTKEFVYGESLIHILGQLSFLITEISYDTNPYSQKNLKSLIFTIYIRIGEGFIVFYLKYDSKFILTPIKAFIEQKKASFISWIRFFLFNYEWSSQHDKKDHMYKTRFGYIRINSYFKEPRFKIESISGGKSPFIKLYAGSYSKNRDNSSFPLINILIKCMIKTNRKPLTCKARVRKLAKRIGLEIVYFDDPFILTKWIQLKQYKNSYPISIDSFGLNIEHVLFFWDNLFTYSTNF
jgi:hypothetical protein